jgi:hypothetical protein
MGVAQGLGHGLDEAAIDAAQKIQFNPARRTGAPVNTRLRVASGCVTSGGFSTCRDLLSIRGLLHVLASCALAFA